MNPYPLGWISPKDRTDAQHAAHAAALANMPARFSLRGTAPDPGPKVSLVELWGHKAVQSALGYVFPGIHQQTGSCVGAGGGNAVFSLAAVEVIRLGDPEQIIVPFWLYSYGISRMLLGDNGEGEGSLGSAFADAIRTYGILDQRESGLPTPKNTDGLDWGESTEMKWSNGKAIDSKWTALGKKHLVKTTAPCKGGDDVRTALRNFYPVTFASNWFIEPGSEREQGSGANAAVVGTLNGNGGHQTSLQVVWDNPDLGPLVWNENQWGQGVYKRDPSTGRASGCWMKLSEVDRAQRSGDGEVYSLSQFDGFPAQYVMVGEANILPHMRP